MTAFTFSRAIKQREKLRLALDGPAGSGKTWTALIIGAELADREGGRVAVIDSERSSARKYASDFDFDHLTLPDWSPHTYMAAVRAAVDQGYAVIIIDSFSHAWEGVLALKDNATARSRSKNSYTEGWREATPVHNELVDTVLRADAHVIATLRTKTEYVIGDDKSITKVGLKPIQRDGVDFEFDVVGDMTAENSMVISKTRCSRLAGEVIRRPDARLAAILWDWLTDGEPALPSAEAERIGTVLNEAGRDAKKAWLDRFGMKPAQLGASRLEEANAFLVELKTETAPAEVNTPPAEGNGSAQHASQGITARQVAHKANAVFKADYDAAPRGEKTRLTDRLRHALVYAQTGGTVASVAHCDGQQLLQVWQRLDDISEGRLTYEIHDGDDGGVTWTRHSGDQATVTWADLEIPATDSSEVT